MSRTAIPHDRQATVLRRSRRRCALCFTYDFDKDSKKGQIAHIDKNPNNNDPDNLVYLCLPHHDEYDSTTSQSKGIKQEELILAREDLDDFIKNMLSKLVPEAESISDEDYESSSEDEPVVSIAVYKARLPIYNAYRTLYSKIMREARIEMTDLFTFANDTHESLFLYGEEIANFVSEVYRRGVDLWASQREMENPERHTEDKWEMIVDKNTEIILWFMNGFSPARVLFLKYLRLK